MHSDPRDVTAENWARACWMQQVGLGLGLGLGLGDGGPVTGAVEVRVAVFVACPASKPRKWREAALLGLVRPTTKPDTDNVAKLYLDGLNGTAWLDDAQVVELAVGKWYGEAPGVLLRVRRA